MMLVELTPVPQSALPVATFKEHLRLGSGFAEDSMQDTVLEAYLRAAMAAIEARTGKVLIERDFQWTLSKWASPAQQPVPLAPVSALIEVAVTSLTGAVTVVTDACRLIPDNHRPIIAASGAGLPSVPQNHAVKVAFLAGFGPDWSDLPADLAQAVMLLASHFYEYRHEAQTPDQSMPFGVSALIERYRTVRLFMGSGA